MKLENFKFTDSACNELVKEVLSRAAHQNVVQRIWNRDASLWKKEEVHQKIINNSLGWLHVIEPMLEKADDLAAFANSIRKQALFDHVIVCGMGGSSLCPEVLRQTFGKQTGFPELLVLDSTDPDQIATFEAEIDPGRSLFIIASKSGTTTEPLAFFKYWLDRVGQNRSDPGSSFIAITDPGTLMAQISTGEGFRHTFLSQSDIGGRYSALSYFGMAPAALMGLDAKRLLERARETSSLCGPKVTPNANPGALLGAIMAGQAASGREKLTIITDGRISAFGLWIEQLVAESTGKEGKGIVPVDREPLGDPEVYGNDRLFISISLGEPGNETAEKLKALETAGHPVVYLKLADPYDLGSQFFLWEFATAFAGWQLGINPFDQPNVQEAKDKTKQLLEEFGREGRFFEQAPLVSDGMLTIYVEGRSPTLPSTSTAEVLRAHIAQMRQGDYLALLSFMEETPEIETTIVEIRTHLRALTHCATTAGYGPRFLHSTGQLHKGGPGTGLFIQLTAPDKLDLPVPGEKYTFSTLKHAQARGDFQALVSCGRRAISVDLGSDPVAGLRRLREVI